MSDGRTHRAIGTISGGGYALAKAQQQPPEHLALERLWHALVELLCRLGAGALAGLLAGYGSHVALDEFTPACLPLLA